VCKLPSVDNFSVADFEVLDDTSQDLKMAAIAAEIAISIQKVKSKLQNAKDLSESVPNTKGSWFFGVGKKKKQIDALSRATLHNSEAIGEVNELIQKAVQFTSSSFSVSTNMLNALTHITKTKTVDVNGRIENLSDETIKAVNIIISQIYGFVKIIGTIDQKYRALEEDYKSLEQKHETLEQDYKLLTQNVSQISSEIQRLDASVVETRNSSTKIKVIATTIGIIAMLAIIVAIIILFGK